MPMDSEISAKPSERVGVAPGPPSRAGTPVVSSRDLLNGRRTLVIRHGCEGYRLQLTRSGKLILTK